MRAGAKRQPRIEPHNDGLRVLGRLGGAWTNPKPAPEAQRLPADEPGAFPNLVLNGAHTGGLRDMRPQGAGEPIEIQRRVAGFLKQGTHQRVAPQLHLAWLGFKHGLDAPTASELNAASGNSIS